MCAVAIATSIPPSVLLAEDPIDLHTIIGIMADRAAAADN